MSTRTMHHVHTVLGAGLNVAQRKGLLVNNPVKQADPPSSGYHDAGQVLEQERLTELLSGFCSSVLYPMVATAAFTGARRNEILALRWSDLNTAEKTLTICRALEETKAHGLRFKEPKTARGIRTISIDDNLVALLAAERERYVRLAAEVGEEDAVDLSLLRLPDDALMFPSLPALGQDFRFDRPRNPRGLTKEFAAPCPQAGFCQPALS